MTNLNQETLRKSKYISVLNIFENNYRNLTLFDVIIENFCIKSMSMTRTYLLLINKFLLLIGSLQNYVLFLPFWRFLDCYCLHVEQTVP